MNKKAKTKFNILKSKIFWAVVIAIMYILICVICISVYYNHVDSTISFAELIYYVTQSVSCVFIVSGGIVAAWQYILAAKASRTNIEIVQVQRAIDLSEYYKDNILEYFPAIRYIYNKAGITKIIGTVHPNMMNDFDTVEYKQLFTSEQITELQRIQNSDEFYQAVLEADAIYNLGLNFIEVENKDNDNENVRYVNKPSIVRVFMLDLINRVLNNMEFLALHFRHNAADDSVVYQSLHQSYLEMIPYLYPYIAQTNSESTGKLYTNVIWLYKKWQKEKFDQTANRSIKTQELQKHGTIIEK